MESLGLTLEQLNDPQLSTIDGAVKIAEAYKNAGRSAETTAAMTEVYGLKLKIAGAALADYGSTSKRSLISTSDIDVLAKANTLLDEQLRIVKAIAAPAIASGVKGTASALSSITKPIEDFNARLDRSIQRALTIQALKRMPDEALARMVQKTISEERTTKIGGPVNPPPIGKPQFEMVKGERFSLGGSQDPLARIGGFTGFQSAQDTAIKQAIEQTLQLKLIAKSTEKTAQVISRD